MYLLLVIMICTCIVLFVESLCSLLAETIRIGDEKKASDLASELARRKSKVALHEALDEEENKSMDTSIKVTVQIEDKQFRSPVLIKLDVDPNVTDVGTLKRMVYTFSLVHTTLVIAIRATLFDLFLHSIND